MSLPKYDAGGIQAAKYNWLEDILAGLLINGVSMREVVICEYDRRTIVEVRGVPRYEFIVTFELGMTVTEERVI